MNRIEELKCLMEKATPGPWTWRDAVGAGIQLSATLPTGFKFDATDLGADGKTEFMLFTLREPETIQIGDARWVQFKTKPWQEMQEANAALVAAARNALPDLLAYIAALEAECKLHRSLAASMEVWRTGDAKVPEREVYAIAAMLEALPKMSKATDSAKSKLQGGGG